MRNYHHKYLDIEIPIFDSEDEARKRVEQAVKEYDLIAEKIGVYSHVCAFAVAYYDEDGKPQILEKAGISGKQGIVEILHEGLSDLVAIYLSRK